MNPREIDTTRRPFVLIWELTQACELACKHCRADARPRCHPDELTTAEGKHLLEEARRFGDGQLVVPSGGDPLARDDTLELVDYGTDVGLRTTLTPSGTTSLTRNRIRALADAGLRRMALSIDGGSASTHDGFRQERGSSRRPGWSPTSGTGSNESGTRRSRTADPRWKTRIHQRIDVPSGLRGRREGAATTRGQRP